MAAKMITRTITVYTYTTGKIDFDTMKVVDVKNHSFPYKLGSRARKELEKSAGNPIMAETTGEALYAMGIETFLQYAKPISKDSVDANEIMDNDNN